MGKALLFLLVYGLCLFFPGCGSERDENGEILAKINDYDLTLQNFENQLTSNLEFEKDFKLTREAKRRFLDNLIEKELLIQEAVKLKLDRDKKFMAAIERYWEATLIKNLMERKGKEIVAATYVSREEIEARYRKMKKSRPDLPPLKEMAEQIGRKIKEEKKSKKLAQWVQKLKQDARISINEELLSKN